MSTSSGYNAERYRGWSPEECTRLLRLHEDGMRAAEIARQMGRSEDSVLGALAWLRRSPEAAAARTAMTPGEIVTFYRQAMDRRKQIRILAELNAVSKDEILRILDGAGVL